MNEVKILVSLRRDAAIYLSMLLDDQLLSITDSNTPSDLKEMRHAYEHVKREIEGVLRSRAVMLDHG